MMQKTFSFKEASAPDSPTGALPLDPAEGCTPRLPSGTEPQPKLN